MLSLKKNALTRKGETQRERQGWGGEGRLIDSETRETERDGKVKNKAEYFWKV